MGYRTAHEAAILSIFIEENSPFVPWARLVGLFLVISVQRLSRSYGFRWTRIGRRCHRLEVIDARDHFFETIDSKHARINFNDVLLSQ